MLPTSKHQHLRRRREHLKIIIINGIKITKITFPGVKKIISELISLVEQDGIVGEEVVKESFIVEKKKFLTYYKRPTSRKLKRKKQNDKATEMTGDSRI